MTGSDTRLPTLPAGYYWRIHKRFGLPQISLMSRRRWLRDKTVESRAIVLWPEETEKRAIRRAATQALQDGVDRLFMQNFHGDYPPRDFTREADR